MLQQDKNIMEEVEHLANNPHELIDTIFDSLEAQLRSVKPYLTEKELKEELKKHLEVLTYDILIAYLKYCKRKNLFTQHEVSNSENSSVLEIVAA